jgi:hypothetical protein
MVSLLPTKFHEILFSSFRGAALTNCMTDRWTDRRTDGQDKNNMSPHQSGGRHNMRFSMRYDCTMADWSSLISINKVNNLLIWLDWFGWQVTSISILVWCPLCLRKNQINKIRTKMIDFIWKFHEILFSSFRGVMLTSCFRSIFREISKFKGT